VDPSKIEMIVVRGKGVCTILHRCLSNQRKLLESRVTAAETKRSSKGDSVAHAWYIARPGLDYRFRVSGDTRYGGLEDRTGSAYLNGGESLVGNVRLAVLGLLVVATLAAFLAIP
jgi:hypothetical protein